MCDFGGAPTDMSAPTGGFDPTTGISGGSGGFTMPTMTSTTAPVSTGGMSFGGGGSAAGAGAPTFGADASGGGAVFGGGAAGAGSPGSAALGTGAVSDIAAGQGGAPVSSFAAPPPGISSESLAEFNSPNPAATATAQNALNAGGGGAPASAPTSGNSIINAIQNPGVGTAMTALGNNIGPLASAGILAFEAANKPGGIGGQRLPASAQPGPVSNQLVGQATNLGATGATLQQPLVSGTLPPGAQASIDQVTQSEIAKIKSQFAGMGLSGSTMESEAIAQAQQSAQARGFQIAQNMAQLGLSDMQLSSNIFGQLLNSGLQSDQEFQTALSQFAASLAGGGGTTVRIGS